MNNDVNKNLNILADICSENIFNDKEIYSYVKERKLSDETLVKFKIGAFPKDLRKVLKFVSPEVLKSTGIIYNASTSPFKTYYRFVIPIHDTNGDCIGITGRALIDDDERKFLRIPKYKNSIYAKGKSLFCLNYAKTAIRKKNSVIVVEGNMDAITCHQAGIYNVVASCGTLLTERHIISLARYCENINVLFDNDSPGNLAADKFIKKRAKNGIILNKINVPAGKDADEFIKCTDLSEVRLFFKNY